jgi:hypothetical protein
VASVAYRVLVMTNLQHTSLVFIGIPALLAIALMWVQPTTASGTVHKTIAIALCLSAVVFGEGLVCILMAAPLFFGIGGVVGRLSASRPLGDDGSPVEEEATWSRLAILMIVPMSLEGVIPRFELSRDEVVAISRTVDATPAQVREALGEPMRFERALPRFFHLGFPEPGATSGHGLAVGDVRSVQFLHAGHHPGTLMLRVTQSDSARVTFTAISDDSYITHWLAWRDAEVSWRERQGKTEVTWTLRYSRRLDPAWYFKPLERYGVSLATGYLIETLATPRGRLQATRVHVSERTDAPGHRGH